ncbi:MAG: hypothetical protein LC775_12365, partial [Acidobacteria bacterium]|nr:hypothetical protein [Acidobacteriota bacterium]
LAPPGDCTQAEAVVLQAEVDRACDRERRCTSADDCPTLMSKIEANQECIKARVKINTRCFRGGDPGHQTAVEYAVNSMINCWALYNRKCVPQPTPVRVRERASARETAPAADRSFMERMAAVTGLTGTALIVYLIISEGSRLFPPRNLIPVP